MVQRARIGGIHDTLAYIDEMMDCNGLILTQEDEVYPHDHFESMHYDFICRSEGDEWTEQLANSGFEEVIKIKHDINLKLKEKLSVALEYEIGEPEDGYDFKYWD